MDCKKLSKGLVHVYYGYGKGKTTCALGLALRANGCGLKIVILQFLKDMATGELSSLTAMDGVTVIRGKAAPTWFKNMDDEQIEETRQIHNANLSKAIELIEAGECDMLVLDEVLDACDFDLIDQDLLKKTIVERPENVEIVITGHKPIGWIMDIADYITEMRKEKHPYDDGVKARRGIEF